MQFQIYPHSFKLSDTYAEQASSEALTISVGLNVTQAGPLRLTGILGSADGNQEIAVATTVTSALTGTAVIPLAFSGAEIYAAGVDGPFRLSRVVVFDERGVALVSDDQRDVYDTEPYSVNAFAPVHAYLPLINR